MATTVEDEEVILKVDQGIHKTDEKRAFISTFQAHWLVTRLKNPRIYHNPSLIFGLVFHHEDTDDALINFKIQSDIRTPTDEDMEKLLKYEVTS